MTTLMDLSLVPPAHFKFLRGLRRVYETQTNFFIHANYAPNRKLGEHDSMTALWLPLDDIPKPHYSGKVAIVGQTPQPDGLVLDLAICCASTPAAALAAPSPRSTWRAGKSGKWTSMAESRRRPRNDRPKTVWGFAEAQPPATRRPMSRLSHFTREAQEIANLPVSPVTYWPVLGR